VLNNPLLYNDPSGESFESWWNDNWKAVVTVVAAVATAAVIVLSAGTATPLVTALWAGAGAGFVGGALGTALNGGNLEDVLVNGAIGAFTGAAAGVAGAFAAGFAPVGAFAGALYGGTTNVIIGGIINKTRGNSFFDGAILNGTIGMFTGAFVGFKAAKAQGLNPMTGATIRPKVQTVGKLQASGPATSPSRFELPDSPQNSNKPLQSNTPPSQQTIKIIKGIDGKVTLSTPIRAVETAIDGGNNIALGVKEHLDDFAKSVNGTTWKKWGTTDFPSEFMNTINNSSNKIHFNLTGIDNPWSAISQGAKGLQTGGFTNWELFQLYSNPGALQRTTFYLNGKIVPNPF
jgi:hypothetical protein